MELRWLEDFLVLAEQRTFARTAAVRRVTQPAFGRRIRALEEWLGTRLFVRSAQGAVLTPAGNGGHTLAVLHVFPGLDQKSRDLNRARCHGPPGPPCRAAGLPGTP